MAKTVNTNHYVSISKTEAKNAAADFVLSWSSLNATDKEEDFYEFFSEHLIYSQLVKENRELILSDKEREWMRKEFETISKIIVARMRSRLHNQQLEHVTRNDKL